MTKKRAVFFYYFLGRIGFVGILMGLPLFLYAAPAGIGVTLPNPLAVNTFFELLESIIQLIFIAGIAISPVFVIWGGFMFITAAGDARKVTSAANILKYAFVGILIIIFARSVVFIIKNVIGG